MTGEPLPVVKPQEMTVSKEALALIPRSTAEKYRICPIALEETRKGVYTLSVVTTDSTNIVMMDQLQQMTACKISLLQSTEADILRAIDKHYGGSSSSNSVDDSYVAAPKDLLNQGIQNNNDNAPGADIVRASEVAGAGNATSLVEGILQRAITDHASDIHIEPHPGTVYVRFRVDGQMYDHITYDLTKHPQVVSRIKILSRLDIAQTRLPQDGRFEVNFGNKAFDLRVSVVPAIVGEKVVMRLLPKGIISMDYSQLGLEGPNRKVLEDLINRPFGMCLVTGPTGSGKTTTLYASLAKIDCVVRNVVTVEDPVEYQFPRITQVQVHPKIGMTFAAGLRAFLRQDPDIIMVGEIRDLETLTMAIQASLTGHLVLTTLHCNDSAAAAARMVDMGAEPFLVSSAVSGIIAQRLLRKVCPHCSVKVNLPTPVRERLNIVNDGHEYVMGRGCNKCRGTGYNGRLGVYETLVPNTAIQAAILRKASAAEIRNLMVEQGIPTLRDDGIDKARRGITSIEEVLRGIYID
jgi:type IV pilus assembly protein PilB